MSIKNLSEFHKPLSVEQKSDIGILIIHGFTSTTSSMRYVANFFINQGFDVEMPALRGHGTKWEDLDKCSRMDWINDAKRAYILLRSRCNIIFVFGLSMGGAIALKIGTTKNVAGIIAVNNAMIFKDPRFWFLPVAKYFVPTIDAIASDIKDPDQTEIAYDRTPLKSLDQLNKMLSELRPKLHKVVSPTLIFKSNEDHVIPKESALYTLKKLGSKNKKIIWLKNSYHVATLDYDKDYILEESMKFINEILKKHEES